MTLRRNTRSTCFAASVVLALTMTAAVPTFGAEPGGETDIDLTDSRIQNAVESELLLDTGVASEQIDIYVAEGIATLSGSVDNILAKDRAVDLARSIKGVRSVVDQIEVIPVTRSDRQIRRDIQSAMVTDPAVESFDVQATVLNGVVTLTGEVDSYAEKQLAVTAAKGVAGVRGVTSEIDVTADFERTDAEIQTDVEGRLEASTRVDSSLITATVQDRAVKLSGTVGSAAERSVAETVAWTVGAKSVDASDLEVEWWARDEMKRKTLFSEIDDQAIEDAVKDAWLYDPRVNAFDLEPSSNNGKVTLTGEVDNLAAKWAAARDARNTQGVWKVTNLIRVRTTEIRDDAEVAEEIRVAMARDPYVDRLDVDVEVIHGRVYLDGRVGTEFELNRAETIAGTVRGVYNVINNLDVYLPVRRLANDLEIKDEVESELFWSPFVDSDEIEVSVDKGEVTLSGAVDSWSEYRIATENAYEGGAILVDNELLVTFGAS